ncbi:major facilitator superfamily domain-containing protein [Favolaschia claudopus]|uniref:Major facilitator superfamily domain-containing protein n=1 Tax=Favolaschia claudopus TaxID=2862362 RepID=A0AAW0EIE6_9AGAR
MLEHANTTLDASTNVKDVLPSTGLGSHRVSSDAESSSSTPSSILTATTSSTTLPKPSHSAASALFLATTDAVCSSSTIVSTSLPTIASELHITENAYSWVGIAYMLTQTAFQPLYGRISDLVGRKSVLYSSMFIFSLGSLLLLAARAVAGIGGGGIVSSVWVITSEIVPVQSRAKWSQALSITWSCSAIAGPLLGGLFSDSNTDSGTNWRYGFYLNLPICFVAFVTLASDASWQSFFSTFDFGGLCLFMTGSSFIVIGFSLASQNGWTAPLTLLLICLGFLILVCGGVYENYTTRDCLFPPSAFTDLKTIIVLVIIFGHNFAFNSGTFYLALFYQVCGMRNPGSWTDVEFLFQTANGSTPLNAGLKLLPYSLGSSLASMPAAWFMNYWQQRTNNSHNGPKVVVSIGLLISTVGFGLLNLLDERSSTATAELIPLVCGIGLGMLFHAPYQVFTTSLEGRDLAAGTGAFFLVRFTGATVGLAVSGAVFDARAYSRIPRHLINGGASIDFTQLGRLRPLEVKLQVLHILATSIQTIWTVCAPCLGLSFLLSLALLRKQVNIKETSCSEEKTSNSEITDLP